MEEFIDTLSVVLPAIGVSALTDRKVAIETMGQTAEKVSPDFVLINKKHGIEARGRLMDGAFVVLKGSLARKTWEGKGGTYAMLHSKLAASGVIAVDGTSGRFTSDYAFDSPSAAAAVCNGRSANGRVEWKLDSSGLTYAEWEQLQAASIG